MDECDTPLARAVPTNSGGSPQSSHQTPPGPQCIDLNHCYEVDGCKALAIVIPNYTGVEHDYLHSGEAYMGHKWDLPFPIDEVGSAGLG